MLIHSSLSGFKTVKRSVKFQQEWIFSESLPRMTTLQKDLAENVGTVLNEWLCLILAGSCLWEGSVEMYVESILAKIFEMKLFILFCRLYTVLKYSVGLALLLVS